MLLFNLNQEVIERICYFLKDPTELTEFGLVCKQIHRLTKPSRSRTLLVRKKSKITIPKTPTNPLLSTEVFIRLVGELISKCKYPENVYNTIKALLEKVDPRFKQKLEILCIVQSCRIIPCKSDLAVKLFISFGLSFFDLEPQWSNLSETGFRVLLESAINFKKVNLDSQDELEHILETIFENDYDTCLLFLIDSDIEICSSSLRTVTFLNKPKCAQILLKSGIDPHIDNNACFFDAAMMGHIKILYLLSNFWEETLASQVLYTAIESDQVQTVEFLLKLPMVKSDRQSLVLAMDPGRGKIRNQFGQTVLEILIEANQDITNMTNLSRQAVRSVCNYVES
jgi:hypothetical protein